MRNAIALRQLLDDVNEMTGLNLNYILWRGPGEHVAWRIM